MKTFKVRLYRYHSRMMNQEITMFANAERLEKLLPRIKRLIIVLDKLPNPHDHSRWMPYNIEELLKK